jgi:hypothetical protein
VTDEAPKGPLYKLWDKLTDKVSKNVVNWLWPIILVTVGAVWAWLGKVWTCVKQPICQVPGWWHGTLIVSAVIATAAALWFGLAWYRVRRKLREAQEQANAKPKPFQHVEILDNRLNLRWVLRRPPSAWIDWQNIGQQGPLAVRDVLSGPRHAKEGCNTPLKEGFVGSGLIELSGGPYFDGKCRHCNEQIFEGAAKVDSVCAQALEEVQRMYWNGTKIYESQWNRAIVLENPEYWTVMRPPAKRN